MFFNIHGKNSKYLKYEVKTNLVQGLRLYVTFFGDEKRVCRFLNNANLQIRRFVKKPTMCLNNNYIILDGLEGDTRIYCQRC